MTIFFIHLFGQLYLHVTKLERGKCAMLLAGRPFPYYERYISFLRIVNFNNWWIYIYIFTVAIRTFKFYLLDKNNTINPEVLQNRLSLNLRGSSHPFCQLPVLLSPLVAAVTYTNFTHLLRFFTNLLPSICLVFEIR